MDTANSAAEPAGSTAETGVETAAETTPSTGEPTGRPGKYQRSTSGLLAALVVTVLGVGGLLIFMGLFRDDLEVEPDQVDYLAFVEGAQQGGLDPAYPRSIPQGWIATGATTTGEVEHPTVEMRFLTDEGKFVGISQGEQDVEDLLVAVNEDADRISEVDGHRGWEGFADDGGDTAFAKEYGEEAVLVYGSAPREDLQTIVDSLTREKLGN